MGAGAALGALLGLGIGAFGGLERQQQQQKQESQKMADNFMLQSSQKDPVGFAHFIKSPEGQKWGKRAFGPNFEMVSQMSEGQAQLVQQEAARYQAAMQMPGAGGGPPSPSGTQQVSTGGQQRPGDFDPSDVGSMKRYRGQLMTALGGITNPGHHKAVEEQIRFMDGEISRAEARATRQMFESPEAYAARKRAGELASLAPDIVAKKGAAEATIGSMRAGAEESTREAIRTSPKVVAGEAARTKALTEAATTVREQVKAHEASGKPWTFADGRKAYSTARAQAARELTVTKKGYLGSSETIKPTEADIELRTKRVLASEGIDPVTHDRMNDGDTVVFPDGSKVHWFGTRKTGVPTSAPATSTAAASGGG